MRKLIARLFLLLILASLSRFIFYLVNSNQFTEDSIVYTFLVGLRFDASALVYTNAVFILLSLIGVFFTHPFFEKLKFLSFFLGNVLFHLLNLIDTGYIKFSGRRSGIDLFSLAGEWKSQLGNYLVDFWYLLILFLVFVVLIVWIYRITEKIQAKTNQYWKLSLGIFSFIVAIGLLARGSVGLLPLTVIDSPRLVGPQMATLALNTPFTIIMSLQQQGLSPKSYYEDAECEKLFNPLHKLVNQSNNKPNVVLIILESMGKEYVGYYNNGKGYTPFLDSLMNHSLVFLHAYSNGKRSIEGLPSILAGMPSLMNVDYPSSYYQANKLNGIGWYLKNNGYSTSFFHGGKNGTMSFDNIVAQTNNGSYFGLNEYPNSNHFDGNWGIFDHYYLSHWANYLNKEKQPFFSTVFTLSSHHPYSIPKGMEGQFPEGTLPIHKTIRYTDYALRLFFDQVKNSSWYANTLFVITADHAAENELPYYQTPQGKFEIPLILFNPNINRKEINTRTISQTDVQGLILNSTGFTGDFFSFGGFPEDSFAIQYHDSYYQLVSYPWVVQYDGSVLIGFYDLLNDPLMRNAIKEIPQDKNYLLEKLKAFIQQYHTRLPSNKTTPD